jgi:hypothetical protein
MSVSTVRAASFNDLDDCLADMRWPWWTRYNPLIRSIAIPTSVSNRATAITAISPTANARPA